MLLADEPRKFIDGKRRRTPRRFCILCATARMRIQRGLLLFFFTTGFPRTYQRKSATDLRFFFYARRRFIDPLTRRSARQTDPAFINELNAVWQNFPQPSIPGESRSPTTGPYRYRGPERNCPSGRIHDGRFVDNPSGRPQTG